MKIAATLISVPSTAASFGLLNLAVRGLRGEQDKA